VTELDLLTSDDTETKVLQLINNNTNIKRSSEPIEIVAGQDNSCVLQSNLQLTSRSQASLARSAVNDDRHGNGIGPILIETVRVKEVRGKCRKLSEGLSAGNPADLTDRSQRRRQWPNPVVTVVH